MKITRSELKSVIKECLKELITEGALNSQMPQQQMMINPMAQNRIQSLAGGNQLMENVLAETLMNSEPDPQMSMMQQMQMPIQQQQMKPAIGNRWAALAFNTQPRVMPVFPG